MLLAVSVSVTVSFFWSFCPPSLLALAVSALFDYALAFASVKFTWFMLVLETIHVPLHHRALIHVRNTDCHAHILSNGQAKPLLKVLSGVLQGCPLSNLAFTLAIVPLL